jgi:glycosyltransferase involved in cell wall biosynthesis
MSKLILKVVHLTSVHSRYDTRVFIKMCKSLALISNYNVSLVVADGKGDEVKDGLSIVDVGITPGGRLPRMIKTSSRVYKKAKELDGDIYHVHDPELILTGLKLKKLGKKVIFDAHEDLPIQILSKPYLNKISKIILSKIFEWFQYWSLPKFDYLIAATPFIRDKLLKINPNTVDINNFPLLNELKISSWTHKENAVVYIGEISEIRGIKEVILALSFTQNVRLNLAGSFSERIFEEKIKKYENWSKVNKLGFLNRQQVCKVLAKSHAGIVTLYPVTNYITSLPIKMFEYMSAGLPVIASNFSLWLEIIEGNQCGICVDPLNPKSIGDAIQYLIDNPQKAEQMGKNARKAVEQKYNWSMEEKKLLTLYKNILQ